MSPVAVTGFAEVTLQTCRPRALARFYIDCFGLTELSSDEDRIWLAAGKDARLGLWKPGETECGQEGGVHVRFAFAAEPGTLDAIARRLRLQGIEVRGPLEHAGGDRSLYARDPEGNVVEAWDILERGAILDALRDSAA